jgi:hypothetical protein
MTTYDPVAPTSYSLDVAFSSATQPLTAEPILAMGYGFAELLPGELWKGTGQGAEKVSRESQVFFSIYDTAPETEPVTLITLHFPDKSPFTNSEGQSGTTIEVVPDGSQPGQSVGCNVKGLAWIIGPYFVSDGIKDGTSYEITVSVKLQDGRVFRVDPDIIVEGGG